MNDHTKKLIEQHANVLHHLTAILHEQVRELSAADTPTMNAPFKLWDLADELADLSKDGQDYAWLMELSSALKDIANRRDA